MDLLDPNILQRRAANPRASVWVGASAGSGKTKVLTDRVLSILLDGVAPEKILCLTFTKAAAAEMADRLSGRLGQWATLDENALFKDLEALMGQKPDREQMDFARRLFARVLDTAGGLKIQTIHSFCQSLLGRFPLEAGVPPHFEVLDERQAADIMRQARDQVLNLARKDETLDQALMHVTRRVQEDRFADLFRSLSSERNRFRAFLSQHGGLDTAIAAVYQQLSIPFGMTEEDLQHQFCEQSKAFETALKEAASMLVNASSSFQTIGEKIQRFFQATDREDRCQRLPDYMTALLTDKLEARKKLMAKKDATARPDLEDALIKEQERLLRYVETQRALSIALANHGLLTLGSAMVDVYRDLKRELGRLDYDDLILKTGDLLTSTHHVAAWVLYKLDGGLDHILIDEAQDTNKEQWTVVSALAEEFFTGLGRNEEVESRPRTIFAVGDIKQSIYSFQRADPKSFQRFRTFFKERVQQAQLPWDDVPMDVSFRSTSAVLNLVDQVFSGTETSMGSSIDKVHHQAFRQGDSGRIECWPLLGVEESESEENWSLPLVQKLGASHHMRMARVLAGQIQNWLGQDQPRYLPSKGRNIQAGDILILVRRRSEFVDHLVREMKNRNIPVAGVDRMTLSAQVSVMDLMALSQFLLLQDDSYSLGVVLKSPLVGFDDDDLMQIALDRKGKSLWQALSEKRALTDHFGSVFKWLSSLLAKTDFIRPFELFSHILSSECPGGMKIDGRVTFSGRQAFIARLGVEAEDPLEEFLSLSLNYEQGRTPSLQGFLHWFESGETQIKRDLEGSDRGEIRIMTVHGAKGLQAPLVILPDTVRDKASSKAPQIFWCEDAGGHMMPLWLPKADLAEQHLTKAKKAWVDEQDEEYRRLLYVALTRAEDQLVVCGYRTKKTPSEKCWYYLVRQGLQKMEGLSEDQTPFAFAQGDPWEEKGLWLETQQDRDIKAFEASEKTRDEKDMPGLQDWAFMPPRAEPKRPVPLMPSQSALAAPAMRSPLAGDGSFGLKRGLLIHRLLQSLPDIRKEDWDDAIHRYLQQRQHDLTGAQISSLKSETLSVLDAPGLSELLSDKARAEVPVSGEVGVDHLGKPIIVSGQIDRLLIDDDRIIIGDYKTLRPVPDTVDDIPETYLHQMAAYRAILQKIYPDRIVSCVIIWTDGPKIMEIPGSLLDPWAVLA